MDVNRAIFQDRKITYAITDSNFKIVQAYDALGVFSDNGYETATGKSLIELVPELVGSEAILAEILAGETPRFELNWVNFELLPGDTSYLTIVILPYVDSPGQIVGLLQVVQDVTEMGNIQQQLTQRRNELQLLQHQLHRQNQELAAANAELQRMNEIKSNFISIAAHELNNPLGTIVGYLEMLLDGLYSPLADDHKEILEIVSRAGDHLATIIRDFLDITRIDAGRIELTLQPTDLFTLVKQVASLHKPALEAKKHQITVKAQPDLPFALIDQTRTTQIFSNLLSNAIKYTPQKGCIIVKLDLLEEDGFIQLSIADNGVGISDEDQEGLFARFYRAKNANETGATGTGLGLYITQALVQLQGGDIWLESEINKGTTFYVTFPSAGRPTSD